MRKFKFLYLSTYDTPFDGHAWSSYSNLPEDRFEKRILVFMSDHGLAPSLISNILLRKFVSKFLPLYRWLYAIIRFHAIFKIDKNENGLYCYYHNEFMPDLSSWILKKLGDYKPDVIVVCWTTNFLTSKTLQKLHEKTGAWIHFSFVDEQHMTGGCHYPASCEGYKNECSNCPALLSGKSFAHYSLLSKLKNLKNVPLSINASEYDGKLAAQSTLFNNAVIFTSTANPKIQGFDKCKSRKHFALENSDFVVFFACSNINSKRKGAYYAIESVKRFAKNCDKLTFLVAGNYRTEDKALFNGIKTVFTGYLNKEDMIMAYCASDVFMSTTIADSGPRMVNYALALGIPVIAFPVGVADILVKTGETGYLAKIQDVEDLADGLRYINSLNEIEREKMRLNCHKIFENIKTTPWYDELENYLTKNYAISNR